MGMQVITPWEVGTGSEPLLEYRLRLRELAALFRSCADGQELIRARARPERGVQWHRAAAAACTYRYVADRLTEEAERR